MFNRPTVIVLSVAVGLLFAVCALGALDPRPAEAYLGQIANPTDGLDRAERLRVFEEVEKGTRSTQPATRSASRRIMTRAFTTVAKKPVMRIGGRAGLVGLAAGTWAVVYYEFQYARDIGDTKTMRLTLDLKPSSGALYGWGLDGGYTNKASFVFLNQVRWSVTGSTYSGTVQALKVGKIWTKTTQSSGCGWQAGQGTNFGIYGAISATAPLDFTTAGACPAAFPEPDPYDPTKQLSDSYTVSAAKDYRPKVEQMVSTVVTTPVYGPSLCKTAGCKSNWNWPTFTMGGVNEVAAKPAGVPGYTSTSAEADQIVDAVVTDPETPTVVPDIPPADDPFWDDPSAPQDPGDSPEYPEEDPQTTPAGDPTPVPGWNPLPDEPNFDPKKPSSDPDEDGDPNVTDPDDDGDGIPDEVDPKPFAPTSPGELPDEHPYADPDGDEIPNKDDPDDDGDGIPDEVDPAPWTPTTPGELPDEHPYADPDGDEIPNKDDPDDDGDGIPDEDDPAPFTPTTPGELPNDHPYADPDEDGQPNKDDPDDDGDGIPDEDDPYQYIPTNPDELPDDHPYADPDQDGEPNKDDTDDDGDGVPDPEDPAPYDPTVPAPDPNGDRDADDVPDTIDPEFTNPSQPQRFTQSDQDQDGSPDTYDPDPSNPDSPATQGTPESDPDGDGVPDAHDPYPQDDTRPSPGSDGDLDQDGQPNVSDPDPYRETEPQGGPTADPDGDNVPSEEDPYPNDPNRPNNPDESVCPIPKNPKLNFPDVDIGSVFPFSLVIYVWDALGQLAGTPQAPSFSLGMFGSVTVPESATSTVLMIRALIGFVVTVGLCLWFYRYITGKGSDAA